LKVRLLPYLVNLIFYTRVSKQSLQPEAYINEKEQERTFELASEFFAFSRNKYEKVMLLASSKQEAVLNCIKIMKKLNRSNTCAIISRNNGGRHGFFFRMKPIG
jgi:hypothetical protein